MQLQCKVPCGISNVIDSSLFINPSLSSLSSTSHAACCPWAGVWHGGLPLAGGSGRGKGGLVGGGGSGRGRGCGRGRRGLVGGGGSGRGRGQGTSQSSCHRLHYHMVLRPKGTSHNEEKRTPHWSGKSYGM